MYDGINAKESSIQGDGLYPFILYHGTDQTIWTLSAEKRNEVKSACRTIIEYIAPIVKEKQYELHYVNNKRNMEILGKDYVGIYSIFGRGVAMCDNNPLFQYDGFYVTNMLDRAKNYAMKAVHFGEIGFHAYYMRTGAERIGLELPPASDAAKKAIDTTLWFEGLEHVPTVLSFEGVKLENLAAENGTAVLFPDFNTGGSLRMIFNDFESVKISTVEI